MDNPGGGRFGEGQRGEVTPEAPQILPEVLSPSIDAAQEASPTDDHSLLGQDASSPRPLPADGEAGPITESQPVDNSSTPVTRDFASENPAVLEQVIDDQIEDNINKLQ